MSMDMLKVGTNLAIYGKNELKACVLRHFITEDRCLLSTFTLFQSVCQSILTKHRLGRESAVHQQLRYRGSFAADVESKVQMVEENASRS